MEAKFLDNGEPVTQHYLAQEGVFYERLSLDPDSYQPRIDAIKAEHNYIEQDEIMLNPDTPDLDTICQKFDGEHTHSEDEVRFVLEGAGVFDIRDANDRYMRVTVEAGDLIVVPKNRNHRFELTESKTIRCVRLFQDKAGWVPHYRDTAE